MNIYSVFSYIILLTLCQAIEISHDVLQTGSITYNEPVTIDADKSLKITSGTNVNFMDSLDVDGNLCVSSNYINVTGAITNSHNIYLYNPGTYSKTSGTNISAKSILNEKEGLLTVQNSVYQANELFGASDSFINEGIINIETFFPNMSIYGPGSGIENTGTIALSGGNITLSSSVTGGGCIAFLGGITTFYLDSTKEIDQTFWLQEGREFYVIRGSYTKPLVFRGFNKGSSIRYQGSTKTKIQNWNYNPANGSMVINISSSGASSDIINIDFGPGYNASLFTVGINSVSITGSDGMMQRYVTVKYNGETPETTLPSECRLPSSMDYGQCSVLHLSSSSSLPPPSSSLSSSSSSSIKATQVSSSQESTQASLNEHETSSRCSITNTKTEFETTIYTTHREYVTGTNSVPITLYSKVVTYFVAANHTQTLSSS
ncbi:uncharacterized protein NDAI_0F00490 [Naumovozyma dairenensis CBS 421]|uniref:Hyphally-regulated cell wall protein N-terminal domain-containing protein n=1 Tax=Naumovozyma dairenensis (strain ATCC 10597 / BCRC 20456 / CBS 421 / NBRC 0211 / NRRL Y-12639) TaxID=1071378 RepID=G0WC57_NAUDC|nr:hypothetical protein NDAI_0F00490 [Naumovozyma dairenensis CBS 421]CCD25368.1 hypothetical protein NDAI_0F00490 [Naumovozyma dairenensis CBS 421]